MSHDTHDQELGLMRSASTSGLEEAVPVPQGPELARRKLGQEIAQVEAQLAQLGLRMEYSLGALDEDGDAIIVVATGDLLDDPDDKVISLAEAWMALHDRVRAAGAASQTAEDVDNKREESAEDQRRERMSG